MNDSLVSVIIPSYNSARYIDKAIQSVLKQKSPTEIIVVDDGSADDLEAVLEQYIKSNYITYLKNDTNLGVAKSRNRGVQAAKGEYVAFLDADDWWKEDKLEKQLELMNRTDCIMSYTSREIVDDNGVYTGRVIHTDEKMEFETLLHHNSIACSSVVLKREVALDMPMEHDNLHEDYLNWLKILQKYGKAYGVKEPLLLYRLSKTGKSRNKLKSAKMTYGVYRELKIGSIRSFTLMLSHLLHGIVKYKL